MKKIQLTPILKIILLCSIQSQRQRFCHGYDHDSSIFWDSQWLAMTNWPMLQGHETLETIFENPNVIGITVIQEHCQPILWVYLKGQIKKVKIWVGLEGTGTRRYMLPLFKSNSQIMFIFCVATSAYGIVPPSTLALNLTS